jgi:hypothetical protein
VAAVNCWSWKRQAVEVEGGAPVATVYPHSPVIEPPAGLGVHALWACTTPAESVTTNRCHLLASTVPSGTTVSPGP